MGSDAAGRERDADRSAAQGPPTERLDDLAHLVRDFAAANAATRDVQLESPAQRPARSRAAVDVTVSELAIESFFPADDAIRGLRAAGCP